MKEKGGSRKPEKLLYSIGLMNRATVMPYPVVISRSLASGLSHKKGKDAYTRVKAPPSKFKK
ncbi:MAG: hypothetical protein AB3K77_12735 [Methanosarcinaceae archaeon]|uniref:hypothetical protein n=1 Tax=Methanosarcina sp. MTP4 TaxID=1434100 RepID=UPI00064F44F1|nr:hypothetical protein [Methanosarcina sp. MTP4]